MSRWGCVPKPPPGATTVLVDDPKGAESHVARVVVLAEREGVAGVEPAEVEVAAVVCLADREHAKGDAHAPRSSMAAGTPILLAPMSESLRERARERRARKPSSSSPRAAGTCRCASSTRTPTRSGWRTSGFSRSSRSCPVMPACTASARSFPIRDQRGGEVVTLRERPPRFATSRSWPSRSRSRPTISHVVDILDARRHRAAP